MHACTYVYVLNSTGSHGSLFLKRDNVSMFESSYTAYKAAVNMYHIYTSIPMRERIKERHWVITKISLGDKYVSYHPVITQGKY